MAITVVMGVPQSIAGCFFGENPNLKQMIFVGVPPFQETSISYLGGIAPMSGTYFQTTPYMTFEQHI